MVYILVAKEFDVDISLEHCTDIQLYHALSSCMCRLAAREGMEEEEALRSITINAAKALRMEHRIVSLEAGKDVDIIIFSGHPFDLRNRINFILIDVKIIRNTLWPITRT